MANVLRIRLMMELGNLRSQERTELKVMQNYDVLVRKGTIYDGTGAPPTQADIAISGDRIVAVGSLPFARGGIEIDAQGKAVAPGFINMLSWSTQSLLEDGHSESEIRQGVTLQVMGESVSMGPLNETMIKDLLEKQGDIEFDVPWHTLGEYLDCLVERGTSTNVVTRSPSNWSNYAKQPLPTAGCIFHICGVKVIDCSRRLMS